MNFRISNDPPTPEEPAAPEPVTPEVAAELNRLDDVESGYVKYLDGNLSPNVEAQVANHVAAIGLKPGADVQSVRTAWATMRAGEPQPEDRPAASMAERDYMLAKNVAFARALDRARQLENDGERPPAPRVEAPSPAQPAPEQPAPQAPQAPPAPTLSLEPLGIEDLREKARTTPAIQTSVNDQLKVLRERSDLATDDQRSRAFEEATRAMAEAARQGLKQDERRLRIQVLALDTLRAEPPRPRPLPVEDPTPSAPVELRRRDTPRGPVVAVEQAVPLDPRPAPARVEPAPPPPAPPKAPEPMNLKDPPAAPPVRTVADPRPLPTPSLDPTDPNVRLPEPERFVVVDEPTLPEQRQMSDELSLAPESAPIKLRANLGLPPAERPRAAPEPEALDPDGPTIRNAAPPPLEADAPTYVPPRPASDEQAPPIRAAFAAEPDTNKARRGPPAAKQQPAPTPPEATREVRPDQIEREPRQRWDSTNDNFRTFFNRFDADRSLNSDMRGQQAALASRRRSESEDARAFVAAVDARADQFRRGLDNTDVDELQSQYRTLLTQERENPEITGDRFAVDKAALTIVRDETLDRERELAAQIARDRLAEVRELPPWERDELRSDAALLLATIDKDLEESPYERREFVRSELVNREDDDNYARVLSVIRGATSDPPNYYAYIAQTDDELRARATARTTSLLEKDPMKTDDMLRRELADARVGLFFANLSGNALAIARAT